MGTAGVSLGYLLVCLSTLTSTVSEHGCLFLVPVLVRSLSFFAGGLREAIGLRRGNKRLFWFFCFRSFSVRAFRWPMVHIPSHPSPYGKRDEMFFCS